MNPTRLPFPVLLAIGVGLTAIVWGCVVGGCNRGALLNSVFHRGFGACGKCNRTWDIVEGHITPYEWSTPGKMAMLFGGEIDPSVIFTNPPQELLDRIEKPQATRGCFPLCESCWASLTPEDRLPFYRQLLDRWIADSDTAEETQYYKGKWGGMRESVLKGL